MLTPGLRRRGKPCRRRWRRRSRSCRHTSGDVWCHATCDVMSCVMSDMIEIWFDVKGGVWCSVVLYHDLSICFVVDCSRKWINGWAKTSNRTMMPGRSWRMLIRWQLVCQPVRQLLCPWFSCDVQCVILLFQENIQLKSLLGETQTNIYTTSGVIKLYPV